MSSFCDFLKDIFPDTSDKVQAWSAFGAFVCTVVMAYYAKLALNSWREQDKHKISIDAFSHMEKAYTALLTIRTLGVNYLTPEETLKYKLSRNKNDRYIQTLENTRTKIKYFESFFEEIEKMANISQAMLLPSNPIRIYYTYLNDVYKDLKNNLLFYNDQIEHRAILKDNLNVLRESIQEALRYPDHEDDEWLKDDQTQLLELTTEYKNVMKELEKLRKMYHLTSFVDDEIFNTSKKMYEDLKKYRSQYSNPKF